MHNRVKGPSCSTPIGQVPAFVRPVRSTASCQLPVASCLVCLPAAWCVCQLLIPFARLILVDKRTWHPATHSWLRAARSSQLPASARRLSAIGFIHYLLYSTSRKPPSK